MSNRVYPVKLGTQNPAHPVYSTASQVAIPPVLDNSPKCSPIEDQGQTSSCTAHAIVGRLENLEIVEKEVFTRLSRLFVYWNERDKEGDTNEDGGAMISDGVMSVCTTGVCQESLWPFNTNEMFTKPNAAAFADAVHHKGLQFHAVNQTQDDLVHCLAAGNTIVFGITVFSSMESDEVAQTGLVPMPTADDQCMGGHAVLIVGYDLKKRLFRIRNSWGPNWGDHGYFYLPFEYVLNPQLASDFFLITKIS
jgi:C1A family cysteine protease